MYAFSFVASDPVYGQKSDTTACVAENNRRKWTCPPLGNVRLKQRKNHATCRKIESWN